MNERLIAGFVTTAVISPICLVCVLGPAAIGVWIGGVIGWLGGFGLLAVLAVMIFIGAFLRHRLRGRRIRAQPDHVRMRDDDRTLVSPARTHPADAN